ncbi:RING-H2 finger protein ATL16-like [Canna indica]|uniref:RING-type E3 ubiquitin transferase n=1 Tax=Canna indica TaxID=4628 RepID=A0AAQ3JRX3_9LILI|nr:RING-H2 finger protein ATL16-like [Canna indica]
MDHCHGSCFPHKHQLRPPPPPPPTSPSSDTSFPILVISILGILTSSILLLSYYVFAVRCCLNWRRSDVIGRLSRSRRRLRDDDRLTAYSAVAENHGLAESEIRAIPTFRYRKGEEGEGTRSFHECAVCLNEFQAEERIRLLPICFHVFHIDCIDTWLQTNANCPLCRASIAAATPVPIDRLMASVPHRSDEVVVDVGDDGSEQSQEDAITGEQTVAQKKGRKVQRYGSLGDESIDARDKGRQLSARPMRRSFSVDSSADRQLLMAIQKILQQNPHFHEAASGEGSSAASGRIRRSFFAFHRHSRSAVLPVQFEQ